MKKVRIGICGAGNIATSAHLPSYAKIAEVEVVAICDIVPERAKAAAEHFGIPKWFASVEEMLAGAELDAVDVCTWNCGHAPCVIAAANAGKDVVCEKPMALNLDAAKAMEKAVKENGVKFMLAVPNRWNPSNMAIKELCDKGELGDIYMSRAQNIRRRGTPTGWFTDKKSSGGGPVIDIAVHRIDAAWYLMGCPKPVSVSAATYAPFGDYQTKGCTRWQGHSAPDNQFDTEDSGAGMVRFENGAIMLFEASWAINGPGVGQVQIYGTKAGATVEPAPMIYGERDGYLSDDKIGVDGTNQFENELRYFAKYVLGEITDNKYPIEQAVQLQSILEGIYTSAKEGKEVRL